MNMSGSKTVAIRGHARSEDALHGMVNRIGLLHVVDSKGIIFLK